MSSAPGTYKPSSGPPPGIIAKKKPVAGDASNVASNEEPSNSPRSSTTTRAAPPPGIASASAGDSNGSGVNGSTPATPPGMARKSGRPTAPAPTAAAATAPITASRAQPSIFAITEQYLQPNAIDTSATGDDLANVKPLPPTRVTSHNHSTATTTMASNTAPVASNSIAANANSNVQDDMFDGIDMISKYAFTGRTVDELSFGQGELIRIITPPEGINLSPEPGWCIAFHTQSSRIGLCPIDYLEYPVDSQPNSAASTDTVDAIMDAFSSAAASVSETFSAMTMQAETNAPAPPPPRSPVKSSASTAKPPTIAADKKSSMRFVGDSVTETTTPRAKVRYGKLRGYATDIIVVRGHHGELRGTSFHVRFTGSSADDYHVGDRVNVYVDGVPRMEMKMAPNGVVRFINGKLRCTELERLLPDEVDRKTKKKGGVYSVRFEHICTESSEPIRYCEATIHVWDVDDVCMVSDIDGTITKSDIGGMWNTTIRIKAGFSHKGYAHDGVCVLYQKIVAEHGCHIVYLTARPLDLIDVTRTYIHTLTQQGRSLPPGPVITDRTNYMGSLRREVIEKTSHEFKTEFLLEISQCFSELARDTITLPIFVAGFGNKDTDAKAYDAAGVPMATTFIVDTKSNIRVSAGYGDVIRSYDDPRMVEWLFSMIELIKAGKLPQVPSRRGQR